MVLSCAACSNRFSKGNASFHSFPHNNPNTLKHWVAFVPRENWKPQKFSKLCSEHFTPDCYTNTNFEPCSNFRLKPDAIPTIHLPRLQKKRGRPITKIQTLPYQYAKKHKPDGLGISPQRDDKREAVLMSLPETEMQDLEFLPLTVKGETLQIFDEIQPTLYLTDQCRMCAQFTMDLIEIFGNEGVKLKIFEKMKQHLPIEVPTPDDKLPLTICNVCVQRLEGCHEVATLAANAEDELKALLNIKHQPVDHRNSNPKQKSSSSVQNEDLSDDDATFLPYDTDSDNSDDFWLSSNMTSHLKTQSNARVKKDAVKIITCKICSDEFNTNKALSVHYRKVHNKFMCFICFDCFDSSEDRQAHAHETHRCSCAFCDVCFLDKHLLKKHIREKHTDKYPVYVPIKNPVKEKVDCTLCDRQLSSKFFAKQHYFKEHMKYACDFCLELFSESEKQVEHTNQVHEIPCKLCKSRFYSARKLQIHVNKEHKTLSSKMVAKPPLLQSPLHIYQCKTCGKGLFSKMYVKRHNYWSHKLYNCDFCMQEFNTSQQESEHFEQVHGSKCYFCDEKFDTLDLLISHLKSNHNDKNPFSCEHCGQLMADRVELDLHRVEHSNIVRNYKCDDCEAAFTTRDKLLSHCKYKHTERSILCEVCSKSFSVKTQLTAHMITHTKEQPFKCLDCGLSFSLAYKLRQHMLIHNPTQQIKGNHDCAFCTASFMKKRPLNQHIRAMHLDRTIYTCSVCQNSYATQKDVVLHLLIHKPIEIANCKQSYIKKSALKCAFCSDFFPNKSKLKTHIFSHIKKLEKKKCLPAQRLNKLSSLEIIAMYSQKPQKKITLSEFVKSK